MDPSIRPRTVDPATGYPGAEAGAAGSQSKHASGTEKESLVLKPRIVSPNPCVESPTDAEPHSRRRVGADGFASVRRQSELLCAHLDPEDLVAQSMPDTSPAKWHLAHTTWFFENFVLVPYAAGYAPHHARYGFLFNSYYNGAGDRHARPARGLLTRPTLREILDYRGAVDEALQALLEEELHPEHDAIHRIVEIGLHHEQQHQELIVTDLKHLFSQNVLEPSYREPLATDTGEASPMEWIAFDEGVREIGHDGEGFCFDNERPRHRVFCDEFALADRLVTNGEFREFIAEGGYRRPELWLDRGWATVSNEGWQHPLYWRNESDVWTEFTLAGPRPLCEAEPASHLSFFEADAFARWAGARLPTEAEWEVACRDTLVAGNFVESGRLHPESAAAQEEAGPRLRQLFGDVWEWTRSSYAPYPGYRAEEGTLGEYNGKFMCDQMVLRGGSCLSPASHLRASYRNFFYPPDRWQMSGVRLAKELA
jgi:ergothioneine biosynthesis protein EgtB